MSRPRKFNGQVSFATWVTPPTAERIRELSRITGVSQSQIVGEILTESAIEQWADDHVARMQAALRKPTALLAASASEDEVEPGEPLPELQARRRWG